MLILEIIFWFYIDTTVCRHCISFFFLLSDRSCRPMYLLVIFNITNHKIVPSKNLSLLWNILIIQANKNIVNSLLYPHSNIDDILCENEDKLNLLKLFLVKQVSFSKISFYGLSFWHEHRFSAQNSASIFFKFICIKLTCHLL